MEQKITVRPAVRSDIADLANITMDCVEGGASIGFMNGVDAHRLLEFWSNCFDSVSSGGRIILVAESSEHPKIVGTVQLLLNMPDNQPHRAEVAKLQVHRCARNRGIAEKLMVAIEREAKLNGRKLLVLDTVTDSSAARLYRRLSWIECGEIPNFALWPSGEYCSTTVFYKQLI
ncbi:MAG: GNAT family N-acetyltransferase [Planctomycetales bacterium]|nr:GNAT family N-acetyltransferase [Planctomycetales bacterium]